MIDPNEKKQIKTNEIIIKQVEWYSFFGHECDRMPTLQVLIAKLIS